ncbi:SURF1 family protein [Altererythrobacter aurantiacus]|uniref:SURF1-like protein n=1 Tax=Parapontixanthobacter aurantiacus TaxID=1463599 RepID=A0A844Z8G0_9SPHN|nr:SURF1 family protein [Parapontixanthobacter aurantiacus]MXO84871.1 SURF1 family protein [Parapontixanthobacter aurantiacus]
MTRNVPIVPTIVVVTACAIMVALGFWQLGRKGEKEALIARYEAALESGEPQPFPAEDGGAINEADLFHPTAFECVEVLSRRSGAGRNEQGQSGFAHVARCSTAPGPVDVRLGWSREPSYDAWAGGLVAGLIVPGGEDGAQVQLREPPEGLQPLARPDPADLPNNHLAYAGQWFFFALTALVIYILALKRRNRSD